MRHPDHCDNDALCTFRRTSLGRCYDIYAWQAGIYARAGDPQPRRLESASDPMGKPVDVSVVSRVAAAGHICCES